MPNLKEYFINSKQQHVQENNVFLSFASLSIDDIEKFLLTKPLLNKDSVTIKLLDYQYIDEVFLDDTKRTILENFIFNLIEKCGRAHRFVYFVFSIKEQDLETLIHNGFYEWLEYWMLFFKFTHMNIVLEISDSTNPFSIDYVLAKRIGNPRLSLFINSDSWHKKYTTFPEDIGAFTSIIKHEQMKQFGLQYATMFINSEF